MTIVKYILTLPTIMLFMSCDIKQSDRLIDIKGKKQHILELGEGEPTVVFITGVICPLEFFDSVQREVSKTSKTISYDRSGLGKSDILDSIRTIDRLAEELNTILVTERFKEPYILVAHSYGGAVARYFLHLYPKKVGGLVFVDCANDEVFSDSLIFKGQFKAEQLFGEDSLDSKGERLERKYLRQNFATLHQIKFSTSVPVQLLVSTKVGGLSQDVITTKLNTYKRFNEYAPQIKYIFTDKSGHHIQRQEPELVIKSVKDILLEVRANRR